MDEDLKDFISQREEFGITEDNANAFIVVPLFDDDPIVIEVEGTLEEVLEKIRSELETKMGDFSTSEVTGFSNHEDCIISTVSVNMENDIDDVLDATEMVLDNDEIARHLDCSEPPAETSDHTM